MTSEQLYRLSGVGLLLGAVLGAISTIAAGVLFPDTNNPAMASNPLNISLGVLGVIGAFLALFGLPGLYLSRAQRGGALWLVGCVLIGVTAIVFGIFTSLTFTLLFPVIAAQAPNLMAEGPPPSFLAVIIIGTLANAIGAALMGWALLARNLYPKWCGWLLVVEVVLAVVGFFTNGPASGGILSQILNILSPLPLFAVLGWIGYELWTGKAVAETRISGAVSPQPV